MLFRSLAAMTVLALAQFAAPPAAMAQGTVPGIAHYGAFDLAAASWRPFLGKFKADAPLPHLLPEVQADDVTVPTSIEWTTVIGAKLKLQPTRVGFYWDF